MGHCDDHPVSSLNLPSYSGVNWYSINSLAEILNQNFQNYSCVPFTDASRPCELGNYPSYVVNVTEAGDVQGALAFAQKHIVRIVIKNTGHE